MKGKEQKEGKTDDVDKRKKKRLKERIDGKKMKSNPIERKEEEKKRGKRRQKKMKDTLEKKKIKSGNKLNLIKRMRKKKKGGRGRRIKGNEDEERERDRDVLVLKGKEEGFKGKRMNERRKREDKIKTREC